MTCVPPHFTVSHRVNLLSTSLEMIPLRIQKRHFLPLIWFICSSYWKRRVLCPAKCFLTKWGQYQHLISWNATISSSYFSSTKYCKALTLLENLMPLGEMKNILLFLPSALLIFQPAGTEWIIHFPNFSFFVFTLEC